MVLPNAARLAMAHREDIHIVVARRGVALLLTLSVIPIHDPPPPAWLQHSQLYRQDCGNRSLVFSSVTHGMRNSTRYSNGACTVPRQIGTVSGAVYFMAPIRAQRRAKIEGQHAYVRYAIAPLKHVSQQTCFAWSSWLHDGPISLSATKSRSVCNSISAVSRFYRRSKHRPQRLRSRRSMTLWSAA